MRLDRRWVASRRGVALDVQQSCEDEGERNEGVPMTVPRCSALRRDGLPCGALASSPDARYCRHHEKLVELHGEEAVMSGTYPKNRKTEIAVEVETEATGRN